MTDSAIEAAWKALEQGVADRLEALFESEPDRLSRLVIEEAGIRFDFSKTCAFRAGCWTVS